MCVLCAIVLYCSTSLFLLRFCLYIHVLCYTYFLYYCSNFFFFFFQAEDGIRDTSVTGVQTCALPIWMRSPRIASCANALTAGQRIRLCWSTLMSVAPARAPTIEPLPPKIFTPPTTTAATTWSSRP